MQLFNQRIITRATANTAALPEEHGVILGQWTKGVRSGAIKSKNEVALHGDFKSQIVQSVFGYRPFGSPEGQTVEPEQKMGVGNVDLALGFFDEDDTKIIAPFELKGGKTSDLDAPMPGRKKSPVDQAWNMPPRSPVFAGFSSPTIWKSGSTPMPRGADGIATLTVAGQTFGRRIPRSC